jgi:hypothetical protein
MRCSARVLSAAALAGAALGAVARPASADPSADITPRSVAPGGTVTVSVSCDAAGAGLPDSIEGVSQAFDGGKVRLIRADDARARAEGTPGILYSGTARVPAGGSVGAVAGMAGRDAQWGVDGRCPAAPGGHESSWTTSFTVNWDETGRQGDGRSQQSGRQQGDGQSQQPVRQQGDGQSQQPVRQQGDGRSQQSGKQQWDGRSQQSGKQQGDGRSQQSGRQQGDSQSQQPGKQQFDGRSQQQGEWQKHNEAQPPVGAQHAVNAGEGGAFTDSVPALVAGGVLIAGAFGAAVHRVWRREGNGTV